MIAMRRMRPFGRRSWIVPILLLAGRAAFGQVGPPAPLPPPLAGEPSPGSSQPGESPPRPSLPDPSTPATMAVGAAPLTIPSLPGGQPGTPINLATALQLAGVRPLDIAAATASVRQSMGLLLQAKALKLPNMNGGVDYFRHDGLNQNIFTGSSFQKDTNAILVGGGPSFFVNVADAIYAPLAAKRVVSARHADVQSARNNSVYAVAQSYFAVQEARGRLGGVEVASTKADQLVELARQLAPGLVAPLEFNRALTEALSLRQDVENARRDWRLASARLAETLLLDQVPVFEPLEPPYLRVELIPTDCTLDTLFPVAQANRPELASQKALVAAANQLVKREQARPLVPNLVITSPNTTSALGLLPAGSFTAGGNGSARGAGPRADITVAAVWQLQGLGFANGGLIRQRKGERDLANVELTRTIYRVNSEVSQALARLQTARARVPLAEEELKQAIESADRNFEGLRQTARPAGELLRLVVRPQEVVAAIIALSTAYQQFYLAINDANLAQFELYRALGQPAQWVNARLATPAPTPPAPPAAGP